MPVINVRNVTAVLFPHGWVNVRQGTFLIEYGYEFGFFPDEDSFLAQYATASPFAGDIDEDDDYSPEKYAFLFRDENGDWISGQMASILAVKEAGDS